MIDSLLTVVIGVGVLGVVVQLIVLQSAQADIRVRTRDWSERAAAKGYRRQTRDSAIAELERSLACSTPGVALRKLGIIAPLLGVVLTASSIMYSKSSLASLLIGSESKSVEVIASLAPLLAGVTVGALLAIFNQVMLIALHREEDRLLRDVFVGLENGWFRDTDDRIDLITQQIGSLGESLAQLLKQLSDGMRSVIAGGEQLTTAVSNVAQSLEEAAADFAEVIAVPSREFKSAAQDISNTAATGLVQYRKLSESLEEVQAASSTQLSKLHSQQMEVLRTEAVALKQIQTLLTNAEQLRLPDWNSSFSAAARAAESFDQSVSGVVTSLATRVDQLQSSSARAADSLRDSMGRLDDTLARCEARCRQTADTAAAVSLGPEEVSRLRDTVRELSKVLESSLEELRAAGAVSRSSSRNGRFPWFGGGS